MQGNGQLPVSDGRCYRQHAGRHAGHGPLPAAHLLYTVRAGYLVLDQAPEAGQKPEL